MAAAKTDRYAVTVVNHATGERWSIHDTKETCDAEASARVKEWGKENCTVEGPIPAE